jgi:hypothetical protein
MAACIPCPESCGIEKSEIKNCPVIKKSSLLNYVIGDATNPIKKPALIAHCVNDEGAWGSGFVVALNQRSMTPKEHYLRWYKGIPGCDFVLGGVQIAPYTENVEVANIIGQHLTIRKTTIPIVYEALETGLMTAYGYANEKGLTMHMPRIGAARARGDWAVIEKIIERVITVPTYIYTLENEQHLWKK